MLRKVQTENGMVQGLVGKDPRVTVFRGVPYAEPPVGELRWKAPRPARDWEGVRKCYEYGDMPMMRIHPGTDDGFYKKELHPVAAEYGMSEDCLYLNIFSPAETREDKLPVFCYIHGGGLQDGYNYEVEFDGERVARRGVIVVMISYRLGLFGFLAHPEITAETPEGEVVSNFGMQDQSLALHWVARNIKNFGGDPERIVICGQSAGAGSVQTQLCSPMNEGIIAGAICQSAITFGFGDRKAGIGRSMSLKDAEQFGADFFSSVGIRDLQEARSMDASELMRRLDSVSPKDAMFGLAFGTCIDGKFVTETAVSSYYNDRLPDVPMMVGVCMAETQGMFAGAELTKKDIEELALGYGDRKEEFLKLADVKTDEDAAALAAVVETVSGEGFGEYLHHHIFGSLGIKNDMFFHLDQEQEKRLSAIYAYDSITNRITPCGRDESYKFTDVYESGGAGLIGTVSGYSAVLEALACGGRGRNGERILKEETVRMFSVNVTMGQALRDVQLQEGPEYGYGLGVRVKINEKRGLGPIGEFGWGGAAGAYVCVDPAHHVSIFFATHVMNFGVCGREFHPLICDYAYEGVLGTEETSQN